MNDYKREAELIETKAADMAYKCGLGVSEWEAFLSRSDVERLIFLAGEGCGTWAKEPEILERQKRILAQATGGET